MEKDNHQAINRRDFLKIVGISTATTAPLLSGCSSDSGMASGSGSSTPIPTDRMTYRTTPSTKDKVSILGYGCMRLPTIAKSSARDSDDEIDQEMVNRLTDYAIEHGVNYFDTSPAYCKGRSEHAMGIALSRYPRDKYYIATKLSNFSPDTWSREASIAMYNNSLKELQVDYLDYMLLHGIGMGGMEAYENRYVKNGILDFLLEERKAGRIRNLGFSYHGDIEVFDYLLSKHDEYQWDFVQIQLNYLDWKHAKEINPRNTDAEYLYGELQETGDSRHHHGATPRRTAFERARPYRRPPEATRTGTERRLLGFPVCRLVSRRTHRAERHDLHGAPARQSPHLLPVATVDGRGKPFLVRHRRLDDAVSDHPV